ncbi:hypothetical protein J4771_01015 [Candidatus Kaistella beijingensis]|uniref:DUF6572 domain-containing protein n=1 Tax=Candidatus Kaistella beijingensis TaxID=2820270 RepID=UPI001CC342A0|nr:DUF6572 domain-containing protein [Candidatus Kaistella beijingensis]UBB89963.1 hypothetical protein J4771_01015 [Candidatus Kaistella beijingensis]
MSVEQIDKVDFISTKPDGNVELTISDHLEWNNRNEHFQILQDKLNSYLNFIESGQLGEEYPNAINKKISIRLIMKFAPDKIAVEFLENCQSIIESENVDFSWKMLNQK